MTNFVSILCPTYNEEKYIAKCIDSILAQDYPSTQWELLLIDGGSTDKTCAIIDEYAQKHDNIRRVANPKQVAPSAINIGIPLAKGEYIVRIDAHAGYPTNYVSTLIHALQTLPDAQNVGGCCNTLPANDSLRAQAIAIACSHPLGVGNSDFRINSTDKIKEVDTVPFGCWRKEWFDKVGLLDETLPRAEDDEFNARTLLNGGKIYLVPSIRVDYFARDTISKMARMFYQYGLYKPLVSRKLGKPATLRQFAPPLFVLFVLCALFVGKLPVFLGVLYSISWTIYWLAILIVSIQKRNLWCLVTFFVTHLSYGIGYWAGILAILTKKQLSVSTTR